MHDPTRRSVLGLGLGSFFLVACARRAAATPHIDDPDPPKLEADAVRCGDTTAANIEGPFYKPGAPHRAVLVRDGDPGERFDVAGVVRSTDCRPIAGAEMEIWHADARGDYDNTGFHFRGALTTDARGRWQLHTIVPGRYLSGDRFRPAHIHIKLRAPDHRALTTQLYFDGDPYNDGDPFIVSSLIMRHRTVGGVRRASFDFVLAPMRA